MSKTKSEGMVRVHSEFGLGLRDFLQGLGKLPLAYALADQDMSTRYARTILGPLWGILSMAFMCAALGLTFGAIFGQPLHVILPYTAISLTLWNAIAGLMIEGPSTFSRHIGIINSYNLPLSIHVYRTVIDKMMSLFHSLVVFVALAFIYKVDSLATFFYFPIFLVLLAFFGSGITFVLGVFGTRYRDLAPAMSSLALLLFLVTPIFWTKEAMASHEWITLINPFFHLLEIGRGPLLGYMPTQTNWIIGVGASIGTYALGMLVFINGRRSIFYWM